ncbi:WavE lipopolysaccharide synthesis family protein [Noviherbaspirillum sedimenti]|uniref:WavE lipopolysaccharide synthesis family protein n=1 Tax=Noviherbaspirillum sedimenti TaxID=2320865 RepID=UPI0013147472|nr:WavE lipopolysaccharide synthesis family protein [Noviherbaspirillum sedimenti]
MTIDKRFVRSIKILVTVVKKPRWGTVTNFFITKNIRRLENKNEFISNFSKERTEKKMIYKSYISNASRRVIKTLIGLLLRLIANALSLIKPHNLIKILGKLAYELNEKGDGFVTFHIRPKKANEIEIDSIWKQNDEDVGIVVQGPYVSTNNFTLETVKLYKRIFPNAQIVLSTWASHEVEQSMQDLQKYCTVIYSTKPETLGSHNLNLQKATTLAGISHMKGQGRLFCLKTRTDQRIYRQGALSYLKSLVAAYPVKNNTILNGRIVELSITSCRYRPWSLCDMFQFGYTDDLYLMWDFKNDLRNRSASEYASKPYKVIDIVNENVAEIFVHRNFAKTIGLNDSADYPSYYDFIKSALILIDKEEVDIFWSKYTAQEYNWAGIPQYNENQLLGRLSHSDWHILISEINNQPDFKKFEYRLNEYEVL